MLNVCPQCESKAVKRNGYTRHGKQNHRCLDCGRQFSLEPVLEEEQTVLSLKTEEFQCCEQL